MKIKPVTREARGFTKEYEAFSKLEVGTNIKFLDHSHNVDQGYLDVSGLYGTVVTNDIYCNRDANSMVNVDQTIIIKLDKYHERLEDWDNCLIWDIEEYITICPDSLKEGMQCYFYNIEVLQDYPKYKIMR